MGMVYPAGRWGKDAWGHFAVTFADYTGPNPYVTGGEAIAPGAVKLGAIELALAEMAVATVGAASMVIFVYNRLTGKVQAFWQDQNAASSLVEVTNGTNLSGFISRMMFMGRG